MSIVSRQLVCTTCVIVWCDVVLLTLGGSFFLALVNWLDEYLTRVSPFKHDNVHAKMGSLFLISTISSIFGTIILFLGMPPLAQFDQRTVLLSIYAGLTMAVMWWSYFYLLNTYPVYQVIPLFQLTSVWLLIFELLRGTTVHPLGLLGVLMLVVGAYALDSGRFTWAIPSSLLVMMVAVTCVFSSGILSVRIASEISGAWAVSFWQYLTLTMVGLLCITFYKTYRNAFLTRIRKQGSVFLGVSTVSEASAQIAYVMGNYAVALAPMPAYATALSSVQSVFILVLSYVFPHREHTITGTHVVAIGLIVAGAVLLELATL